MSIVSERAMTDFQRMAELLASGIPGATTTYDLPPALGTGQVTLVAAEPGLLAQAAASTGYRRYFHGPTIS